MRAWTIAALLLLRWPCAAASDWELRVDDRQAGIEVFSRINERGYPEFRAVTKIRSTLGAFVAMFKDVDNMPNWVHRTRKVEKLKEVSEKEVYAYTVNVLPLPLYDRDAIVHTLVSQDSETLKVTVKGSAAPDYAPQDKRYVRMPVVESLWTFTPLGGGMVEVAFQGYGDPGGSLSTAFLKWFVRLSVTEAPYDTLLHMRNAVTRPEYQSARYSFIREPAP
jgi:hypothetical protein